MMKRATIFRTMRFLRRVRGWRRLVQALTPRDANSIFCVENRHGRHFGALNDFIQRQLFLFGGYEEDQIDLFLSQVPNSRRGLVLDIGANIGVHSVAFSSTFRDVVSFEPNRAVCNVLKKTVSANDAKNVSINEVALGDKNSSMPLFLVDSFNLGLGTLVHDEQYDRPIRRDSKVPVRVGDDILVEMGISRVDAIKIDVQGFEDKVLEGLRETLKRDRPIMWIELTRETGRSGDMDNLLRSIIQNRQVMRFESEGRLIHRTRLVSCDLSEGIPSADYLVI